MFRKISIFIAACCIFIAFRCHEPEQKIKLSNDIDNREQLLMEVLLQALKYNHYAPEDINDSFSAKVYDLYIKRIDNSKRFFLKDDVKLFEAYRLSLDDAALKGNFEFFDIVNKTYDQRFALVKSYYEEFLAEPFDFSTEESFETDGDKLSFAVNKEELRERWRKYLKLQVLGRVQERLENQEKAKEKGEKELEIKTVEVIEKEEREKLLKNMNNWVKGLEKETRNERINNFVNIFINAHEPHSGYFPPLDKQNFDIRMSGKLEGIGAQLREEDGFIKVVNVVPGSASARQGELEVNDKIIKVSQGSEEPVDVVDMRIDDVLPMIRGSKGTEVRLTVKKTSGEVKVIPIIRDVVVLEDSYAKSAIIENSKVGVKVGLIDLRSFYADFDDPRGRRCSKDVKAEVDKLMDENIDGIVIDLRFNGGGSLQDVVDMAGIFIEKGPIVQVKSRDNKPFVYEDRDETVLYKGPLVILVNSFSASASEIMAAALQDYGRAIIVGSAPSTFGKGTVQRFFNLDQIVPAKYTELGELGSVKITIQKFYRINGGSNQLKGVIPDIILPGAYSYMEVGEKEEDYPMAWSEIGKANYKESAEAKKVMEKVKAKSEKRVSANKTFQLIDENAKWLKSRQEESNYSLSFNTYDAEQKKIDKEAEKYKSINKDIDQLLIKSLKADKEYIASDSLRVKGTESWHKTLKQDAYLEEVSNIIHDWKKSKWKN
jgi:carboxyl-terminal processing protease